MSKQLDNKINFLKPIKEENSNDYSYDNKGQKDMIDPYTKGSLEMIKQHFYPPTLDPYIPKKNHRSNNSQKRPMSKKLFISNYSKYLNPQNLFGAENKKKLKSEKTEATLINENLKQNKNKINNLNRIKNITNKYHINQQNQNKILDNTNKNSLIKKVNAKIYKSNNIIINNNLNINLNILQNPLFRTKNNKLNNGSSQIMRNAGMLIINPNIIGFKKNNIYDKNIKNKNDIKRNIKMMPPSSIIDTNKNIYNQLSSIGKIIMINNNKNIFGGLSQNKKMNNQKHVDNILQDNNNIEKEADTNKKPSHVVKEETICLNKENNSFNYKELEDIDNHTFFLRNLRYNNTILAIFLQLIEAHMNIELLLNKINNFENINNENYDDIFLGLYNLVIAYFKKLYLLYDYYNNKNSNTVHLDNFFLYQSLNYIFYKAIKIQICFFSLILVILSQSENYNTFINNNFCKIIKDISNPLFSIFKNFIQEEINSKYPELIINNLMPDFKENFNKLHKIQKFTQTLKHSEIIILIQKQLNKSINSLEYYSNLNLKHSILKPFDDALNQLLFSLENRTLNQFLDIVLNTLLFRELYGEIEMNISISSNLKKDISNIQMGSSIVNRINDFPPYLPSINQKYKYTLVLDIDETLIHFSFTNIDGMLFIRPYCFEFLEELNDLYEIITFSAETQDYIDPILNIIDKENKIIKYRLYRHHCLMRTNLYKDLNLIGRDLSKVIYIDNLETNFKMNPYNGILIKTWITDINDLELKDLSKILKDIATLKVNDVRPVIRKINDEIKIRKNEKRPYENINVAKLIGESKTEVLVPKHEVEISNQNLVIQK